MVITLPHEGIHTSFWPNITEQGSAVSYLTYVKDDSESEIILSEVIEVARWVPERPQNEDFVIEIPVASVCYLQQDMCWFFLEYMDAEGTPILQEDKILFLE